MKLEFLETIKIKDSVPFNLEYHQKRYESVLRHYGATGFKSLSEYIKPPDSRLYRCRFIYTPQNIEDIKIEYLAYEKRDIKRLKLVFDDEIEYSFKSTNRDMLDNHYKKRGMCDDIVIVKNSLVTDTSIANIAFYDGIWKTPAKPLLKGTTRQRYIDTNQIVQTDIKVEDIEKFSKVALLNAMVDFDIITDENVKDVFC